MRSLRNGLQQATGEHVFDQTVRMRLDEGDVMARYPLAQPVLTAQHRAARLPEKPELASICCLTKYQRSLANDWRFTKLYNVHL